MALDPVTNFGNTTVSTTYDAAALEIVLSAGGGAKLPDPVVDGAYNLTWWNSTDYASASQDPNKEIIRVTGPSGTGNTKTILRAQEGTAASTKNTAAKTYSVALSQTKAVHDAIKTSVDRVDQDVTSGSAPTLVGTNITAIPTENILMCEIGSATYDSIHDLINNTQSSGITEGFELSNSRTALELDMAVGKGYLKIADSAIAETCAFDITSATENITLSSGVNYLYIDYNAGSPQVVATTDRTTIELNRQFTLGRAFKDASNGLHILNSGVQVSNLARTEHERLLDVYGFQHVSGAVPSEVGTLNLDITAGIWYSGHNKLTTNWVNTDTEGDTFVYQHYGTASWIIDNAATTDIDCTHYNDGDDVLGDLTANAYGVQWVYIAHDSHVNIIYDTINGALAIAQAAQPPTSLPPEVSAISALIGKIIVRQSGVITSIESTLGVSFTSSGIIEHNDTGNLNAGDYKHLTAVEKTLFDTIESGADKTDTTNVDAAGAVMESDYNAHTLLQATSDDTPVPITIAEQRIVGRITAGNIKALTAAEVLTLIAVTAGADVTADNAPQTHAMSTHTDEGALATLNTVGTTEIDDDAVTYGKIQNVSATDKLLGRSTAGAGIVEEIPLTAAGRALLDDISAAAQRTTLSAAVLGSNGDITGLTGITADIVFAERADHASTPGAGFGYVWVKNTAPSTLIFTDDAGTDTPLGSGGAGTTITAESFSESVAHLTTDADAGKTFTITSFPAHGQITAIRVRADFTAGQQADTGSALVNNGSGIAPGGTAIAYDAAVADFAVLDYIWIDDECMRVSADDGSTLTVVRGLKGTMDAFHDDNATIVKANHGVRVVLFKDTNRNYSERIIELSSIMTYKGVTDALISANDDYFGLTADIQNLGNNDFLVVEDTVDEICRVQNVNHDTVSATYDYTIFVQDDLAAHDTTKDVKKLMVYDLDTPYNSGTTLYGTVFIDEKITGTANVEVEVFTDSYT